MIAVFHAASISLISLLNGTFDAVPWHRSFVNHLMRMWDMCSEESWDLNTHISATFYTVAEALHIDWDSSDKWHHGVRGVWGGGFLCIHGTHFSLSHQGLSAIYLNNLKAEWKANFGDSDETGSKIESVLTTSLTNHHFSLLILSKVNLFKHLSREDVTKWRKKQTIKE